MCAPDELRASRSRPGSRRRRDGSAGAHSSRGLLPPPRCDTEESDHGCPCSPERLLVLVVSGGVARVKTKMDRSQKYQILVQMSHFYVM